MKLCKKRGNLGFFCSYKNVFLCLFLVVLSLFSMDFVSAYFYDSDTEFSSSAVMECTGTSYGLHLENLLGTYGSFSTDSNLDGIADGWLVHGGVSGQSVLDGKQYFTPSGQFFGIKTNSISLVDGNYLYFSGFMKSVDPGLTYGKTVAWSSTSYGFYSIDGWNMGTSAGFSTSSSAVFHYFTMNGSQQSECQVTNTSLIDLSVAFGSGYEPTRSDLDNFLQLNGYFNDSIYVSSFQKADIDHSAVVCSKVYNSTLYYSTIRNADIENMTVKFANVDGDVLSSGQIKFDGCPYTYYGPFSLSDIRDCVNPFTIGSLVSSLSYVNLSDSVKITYSGSETGLSVTLDASEIKAGANSLVMYDDGTNGDSTSNDGVYTSVVVVDVSGSGDKTLTASIDDNRGNTWNVNSDIYLDNTNPSGDLIISDFDNPSYMIETDKRNVLLNLSVSDNYGILGCKYSNNLTGLGIVSLESCSETKTWQLTQNNGVKTVYVLVYDLAGNTYLVSDSILLNQSEYPTPTVIDDGDYSGYSDRLHAYWYSDIGADDSETTFEYRIYHADSVSECNDSTNITSWQSVLVTEITKTGLSLIDGDKYFIGVKAYSGYISDEGFSDGIIIDSTSPLNVSLSNSTSEMVWSTNSSVFFNFSSSDSDSGILGFSYSLSTDSSYEPDSLVDVSSNPGNVSFSGLSDGIFYFKIKSKNYAGLFSNVKNFTIYHDSTAPSIPVMKTSQLDGSGNMNYSWYASVDSVSGISEYNVVISDTSDFSNVLLSTNTSDLFYVYTNTDQKTYYAKVRAKNNAGLWSDYSNNVNQYVDVIDPGFMFTAPRGYVLLSDDIFLRVKTIEDVDCQYKLSTDSSYEDFYYTGEVMHEQFLDISSIGSYDYDVLCTDSYGNSNTTVVSFNVVNSISVNSVTFDDVSVDSYEGSLVELGFNILGDSGAVSNINYALLSVTIDGVSYDDYSVLDTGNGEFILYLRVPYIEDENETKSLILSYDGVSTGVFSLNIDDVSVKVNYLYSGGSTNNLSNIVYHEGVNLTTGIAAEGDSFSVSESSGVISSFLSIDDGYTYIFVGDTASSSSLSKRNRLLSKKIFSRQISPSFFNFLGDSYYNEIVLFYEGIAISGDEIYGKGRYSFLLRNDGLTSDNMVNVSIVIN
jgi:hypothetical protein